METLLQVIVLVVAGSVDARCRVVLSMLGGMKSTSSVEVPILI